MSVVKSISILVKPVRSYRALERIRFKLYACIDNKLDTEGLNEF